MLEILEPCSQERACDEGHLQAQDHFLILLGQTLFILKLADALILSLSLALIIIGVHQSMTVGVEGSYAIFMFAVALLFWFQYRKIKNPQDHPVGKKNSKARKKH